MLTSIRLYLRALWKHWEALLDSAIFAILAFVVEHLPRQGRSNVWIAAGCGVFAVLFFFAAGYRAWKDQYDLYRRELERNSGPVSP